MERVIRQQQDFETPLVKTLLNGMGELRRMVPDEADSFDRITAGAMKRQQALQAASAAAVKPLTHTIKIEAVK